MSFVSLLPVVNFLIFYQAIGRPPSGLVLSYSLDNQSWPGPCPTPAEDLSCSPTILSVS